MALLYLHGFNYPLPVDARPVDEPDLLFEAVALDIALKSEPRRPQVRDAPNRRVGRRSVTSTSRHLPAHEATR